MRAGSRLAQQMVVLLLSTATGRHAQAEVKFIINVLDEAGVGFNDTTPAKPVGGNSGTTLGKQRLIAFQAAADAWGRVLESPVPIVVDASFAPLDCLTNAAVAGQAAPYGVSNLPALPTMGSYPVALANRILGKDIAPTQADIVAQFNGNLMACVGTDWYYGLDSEKGTTQLDLLSTVMHELTHGLGFNSDVHPDTGAFSTGHPQIYGTHVLDTSTGKHWTEMTDAERKASLINVRKLVWDGERAQAVAAWALAKGLPSLQVSPSPAGYVGIIGEANYGPVVADGPSITGRVVAATASAACTLSINASGKIALVTSPRGCSAISAASIVQESGGLAMLFDYDVAGSLPPLPLEASRADLAQYTIKIPTLALTHDDADRIESSPSSTVTLSADNSRYVGTDTSGRPLLYTSDPVQPGSVGGHWEPLARPDLLLEPFMHPIPCTDLVMERALLWDLGWTGKCGNGTLDAQEECDNGVANSDRTPNACRLDCKNPSNATSTGGATGQGGSNAGTGGSSGGTGGSSGGSSGIGGSTHATSGAGGTSSNRGSGGTTPDTSTGTRGGKSSGCGCQAGRESSSAGVLLLISGLALMGRRRVRRQR